VQWARPGKYFKIFKVFFNCIQMIKFQKYKNSTSKVPKPCKLCQGVDKFRRNNHSFGKDFKFPTEFELKIEEANCI
jgi:hypothetical protein